MLSDIAWLISAFAAVGALIISAMTYWRQGRACADVAWIKTNTKSITDTHTTTTVTAEGEGKEGA